MYNGIGLQTARGSGTNGYVQSNRFFVKPRLSKVVTDSSIKGFGSGEGTAGISRKPNREILEHDRKRQIQLKLLVLEEKLTDQGYTDSEIAEKMEETKRNLEAAADALEDGEVGPTSLIDSKISDTQTHQIAARKERQMETLRAALGIGADNQNKQYALVQSDSEEANNDDEPGAISHKKDGNSKKSLKGAVDGTSDLRKVKKSRGDESDEDAYNESGRHSKKKSGRGHRGNLSDSDDSKEKVVKKDKKKSRRTTTSSDSDGNDSDVKSKKKTSRKSKSRSRRHDSDSSDSGSETDSSSDSGSRKNGRSLKKIDARDDNGSKYNKKDLKEATKKPRKTAISSESDQSDYVKKKKIASKKSRRGRRHDSDSSSSESDSRSDTKSSSDSGSDDEIEQEDRGIQSGRNRKEEQRTLGAVKAGLDLGDRKGVRYEDSIRYKPRGTSERDVIRKHEPGNKYDSDSSSGSDVRGRNDQNLRKGDLGKKTTEDSHRRFDRDLNDRRRTGKEHASGDDEKTRRDRDLDGLDTLRKLEKLNQPKEEKMVNSDRIGKEPNRSKRKGDDENRDEQPDRKSRRRDLSDLEYSDEAKHSLGKEDRSENRITDRWGADSARDYDVARRESGEDRERQGRKHRRDEEEDTHRINDRDKEQQQPDRDRRELDDRKSSKYDRDIDRDSSKRARYDDSRSSGKRYDEDDDRHGRKHSDGRHDDRRSRR